MPLKLPFQYHHGLLHFCIILSVIFTSCKKEVAENEFAKSPEFLRILSLNGDGGGQLYNRPGGGYIFTYTKTENYSYDDIGVAIINEFGAVVNNITFGGKAHETLNGSAMDKDGNVYLVGSSYSSDLRIDKFTSEVKSLDAFIAKVDEDGNLLWIKGYSDTANGARGAQDDIFNSVILVDNKVYCFGTTDNFHPPVNNAPDPDNWMVVFDENGELIKDMLLPTAYTGEFAGVRVANAIGLKNGDIAFRWSTPKFLGGGDHDTSALLLRYRPSLDSILWVQYFSTFNDEGDLTYLGESEDETLVGLNSTFTVMHKFSPLTGELISNKSTVFSLTASALSSYFGASTIKIHNIDDYFYVVGAVDQGYTVSYAFNVGWFLFNNSKPWIMKLSNEGKIVYTKDIEIPTGFLGDMVERDDGNFEIMGSTNIFNTKKAAFFMMTIDTDGNPVYPKD
jgi:hypothetical protein